jgi:hypothetical protein
MPFGVGGRARRFDLDQETHGAFDQDFYGEFTPTEEGVTMITKIGIAAAAALVALLAVPHESVAASKPKKAIQPAYAEYAGGGQKCHGGFAQCTQVDIPPMQSNYRSTHKKQVKPGS